MTQTLSELQRALIRSTVRALVRCALRWAVKLPELITLLKESYLVLAQEELGRHNQTPSISKLSVMTGIHRKYIPALLEEHERQGHLSSHTALTRLVGLWQGGKRYQLKGAPRALSCVGAESEFAGLVAAISSDLNPYAVLYDLERVGMVSRNGDKVALNASFLETRKDAAGTLRILETDVERLAKAVFENIGSDAKAANLHLTTEYDSIPASALPHLRQWLLLEGSKFHGRARAMISKFDTDLNPHLGSEETRYRVAVSAFSFIEEHTGASPHEKK